MLAHPPSYFWLERSLHVYPVKSIGSAVFGPGNAKKMDLGRLLRAGEKVKGQTPSRKKPKESRVGSRVVGVPHPWKSPIPLDDTGLLRPIKDGIRGLDFASTAYPYSLAAGERFRATSPCLLR
jgi:hypothetical protein